MTGRISSRSSGARSLPAASRNSSSRVCSAARKIEHPFARTLAEHLAAAAPVEFVLVADERAQHVFERIVVAIALRTFEARGFRNRPAYLVERAAQPVIGTPILGDARELLDVVNDAIDLAIAIECDALPRRIEVAPLAQRIRCAARDRPRAFALDRIATPQQPAHPRARDFSGSPRTSARMRFRRAAVATSSGATSKAGSTRASTGRSRSRSAQNEWMVPMRASSRSSKRAEKMRRARRSLKDVVVATGAIDLLAQSKLQLARGFFGESHRDDGFQSRASRCDHRDDAVDQLGGFAGAGRRLDDQRGIEVAPDALAHALVGRRRHGLPRRFHSGVMRCASLLIDAPGLGASPPDLMRIRCSS